MTDVFISYAREDRETAQRLAAALEARGWSVWWDREIPVGHSFDQVIEQQLDAAKSVVVLWSQDSAASEWVKNEAAFAAEKGVLIPAVLLSNARPPLEFRRRQTADLEGWRGDPGHAGFRRLCDAITVATTTVVVATVPSASTPVRRWPRRGSLWALVALAAVTIAIAAYWAQRQEVGESHQLEATGAVTPAELTAELRGGSDQFVQLAQLTNGRLASASGREVKIWNLATLREESTITNATGPIAPLPDNKMLASRGGEVVVWGPFSAPEEKLLEKVMEGSWSGLEDLVVGHGKVIGCTLPGGIAVWSLATGKLERRIETRLIAKLLLLRDGRLVTGRTNGLIEIWNVSSGEPQVLVREGTSSGDWIMALVELHDGRLAYTTKNGTAVNIWSPVSNKKESTAFTPGTRASGSETTLATTPGTDPYGLAVLADGQLAILEKGGEKNRVSIWNRDASRRNGLFEFDSELTGQYYFGANLVPLPDGRFATGGYGRVQIWRLPRATKS
jgi:WD40 repeat protein